MPRLQMLGLTLLPLLAVHAAYLLSADAGHVPWCWPWFEGCTSISRAARFGTANLLFKLLMLPHALLLARYWSQPAFAAPVRRLGVAAAGALALYLLFLGWEGGLYQGLRRFGITAYFGGVVLAQLLVLHERQVSGTLRRGRRLALLVLAGALVGLGLLSLPAQYGPMASDAAVNRIEWLYALLMILFYPVIAPALPSPRDRAARP